VITGSKACWEENTCNQRSGDTDFEETHEGALFVTLTDITDDSEYAMQHCGTEISPAGDVMEKNNTD